MSGAITLQGKIGYPRIEDEPPVKSDPQTLKRNADLLKRLEYFNCKNRGVILMKDGWHNTSKAVNCSCQRETERGAYKYVLMYVTLTESETYLILFYHQKPVIVLTSKNKMILHNFGWWDQQPRQAIYRHLPEAIKPTRSSFFWDIEYSDEDGIRNTVPWRNGMEVSLNKVPL